MHTRTQIAVSLATVALAAAFAGCAAAPASLGAASAPQPANAASANASWNATLYFTPEGALAPAPPSKEGYVTLPQPVNAPFVGGAPAWKGVAARDVTNVSVRLFVTSSSANVAANAVPLMPLPSVTIEVISGKNVTEVHLEGPPLVHTGQVVEMRGAAPLPTPAPAGELKLRAIPYYSHVAGAAEFRIVMGPDHPTSAGLS